MMKRRFLLAMAAAVLLGGCADGLIPEKDREAAAFSPDPINNMPERPTQRSNVERF